MENPTILFLAPSLAAIPACLPDLGDCVLLRDLSLWRCSRHQPGPSVAFRCPFGCDLDWVKIGVALPAEVRPLLQGAKLLVTMGGGLA
jgi:hypothetical protein